MKPRQHRPAAPQALGLIAALVAGPAGAATASQLTPASNAELNFTVLEQYAGPALSSEQVTSISQFSDVRPTDWAYQALSNLIERYGCVAGYPDGTYRGQKAMTRFEAAALLNACLDRVTEVTDELKRLMAEFEKELAVLKGRVDGLEAKVGELEANQFSTTTRLNGLATMVLGGAGNTGLGDEVTVNDDVQLNFDTSFTGKDLLRTTLRAGNFGSSVFGSGNTTLETAFGEEDSADSVAINRLFYQFPIGEQLTATVGAKVEQPDMLAMWPTAYTANILEIFTRAGAPATYSKNLGAGAGIWWQADGSGFNASVNYISAEGAAEDSRIGAGEEFSVTAQVGYAGESWGAAFAYTYAEVGYVFDNSSNNIALSAYWSPVSAAWAPSISAGFGYSDFNTDRPIDESTSWMVGLQWDDAFLQGNALGMALGSAGQSNAASGRIDTLGVWADPGNNTLAYELWYRWQVTDNISVTPAFFWIENSGRSDTYGGLVKTTFTF
ncbi:MAG: iron uptake porin [Prochlorococcaceae cyanobacterium]